MNVRIGALLIGVLLALPGCGSGDSDSSSKKEPPPVVQEMNIVQPDESSQNE